MTPCEPAAGPRVSWFVAENPGALTLQGTCCYAMGEERLVLVDPGPAIPGQMECLEELIAGRPVDAVCLTHAHLDHAGIASLAARRLEAPVAASRPALERLGLQGVELADGDALEVDGGSGRLTAIRTPGHSADHLAYLLEPSRVVFTGDLVLGAGSSAVLHPDGDVGSCLASFHRVLSLFPGRLYPGHGAPVDDGEARLRECREHRLERHAQVTDAIRSGVRTVSAVRARVYGELDPGLVGAAEASIRAHLVYMREQGEAVPEIVGLDDTSHTPEET